MSVELKEDELALPPADVISKWGEAVAGGGSLDERRTHMEQRVLQIERALESSITSIHKARAEIEETRMKYENMSDVIRTMEALKGSLEEHMKTIRLNESSFAGTSSVLEYDEAKRRTNELINVIRARSQWQQAKEALAEGGSDKDNQQRLFEFLVAMQQSNATLSKYVHKPSEVRELEELKDRFLSWQSAALIFAIQQADFDRLAEIQKTYEQLDRKDEFISIFRRVTVNRLREFRKEAASIQELLDALLNEVHLLYTHNLKVLKRFLPDKEATDFLLSSIMQGLKEVKLGDTLNHLVTTSTDTGVEQSPIETMSNINKIITAQRTRSITAGDAAFHEICSHIESTVLGELVTPLRASLTSMLLAKANPLDLQSSSGSHRSKVDALKAAQVQLLQHFQDIFVAAEQLFGPEHVRDVVQQSIDKGIDNLLAKMKNWEYWLDRNKRPRELDDVVLVVNASGQFCYGLQDFNDVLEQSQTQLSVNLKSAQRWNRSVCERVLMTACDFLTAKLAPGIQNSVKNPAHLSSLATSPNEYVTQLGQELLQFFHRWEQFWLDDNIVHAFYLSYKKKYEGDDLFKKTINDVANQVVRVFVKAVEEVVERGEAKGNTQMIKQFAVDTAFLKDAFEDMRTGNVDELVELERRLKGLVNK